MRLVENIKILMLIAVGLSLPACNVDESLTIAEQGRFTLNISTQPAFITSEGVTYLPENITVPDAADYSLTLSTDGYTHTWPSATSRSDIETYTAGQYTLVLKSNGEPAFGTTQSIDIQPGEITQVDALCKPLQAMINIDIATETDRYAIEQLLYQCDNSQYNTLQISGNNFVEPGNERLLAKISDASGRRRIVNTGCEIAAKAAEAITLPMQLTANALKTGTSTITISDAIFTATAPTITTKGFASNETVHATEGITLSTPLKADIKSDNSLNHVWISTDSPLISLYGADARIDLMHLTTNQQQIIDDAGLTFTISPTQNSVNINFTHLVEQLATITSAFSTFTIMAEDMCGVCSEPVSLCVSTDIINFTLLSTTPAPLGIDRATITVAADVSSLEREDFSIVTDAGVQCAITGWNVKENGVEITFEVPAGDNDVNIIVNYMGLARLHTVIGRIAPKTLLDIDAFATSALIIVECETPQCTEAMTRYAVPYVDGKRASIASRHPDHGYILINGLNPGQRYTVSLNAPATTEAATATFSTETARQLPDPSFEDWRDLIKYDNLPRGGRYSATTVALFNRQNYSDIDVKWVKTGWTSVNAKTFDTKSKRHNTWYMQPSTALVWEPQDGYKAMCLTSVGWDHDGEAIPDYVQKQGQNLMFNPNVPKVSHRSAGRLFLGEYKYDATTGDETYVEGIAFASRPSSLNGFYKYLPDLRDNTDCGIVTVTVYGTADDGKEIPIASGRQVLNTSPDYKAFNIPLTYQYIGIKASRITVFFASSQAFGTQAHEDVAVPVTPSLDESSMTGSRLWIDNLSLSY